MLLKCLRSGVHVPGVRMVDAECGVLGLEWIEGRSVRILLAAVTRPCMKMTKDGKWGRRRGA